MKIALFGTSADPPTSGHQEILKWLCDNYDLVLVWASDNPFKSHHSALSHRAQMLYLVIESITQSQSNIRLQQDLSSRRTIESVAKAKKIWGEEARFTVVIGSDLVSQMLSWYRIQELLEQVELLIVPRPGYGIVENDMGELQNLGAKCSIADLKVPAVSSTAYREKGNTDVVPLAVKEYIDQEQLYLCQNRQTT